MTSPIEALDKAIASLARAIETTPGMPRGTRSSMVDDIRELTAQRAEIIRQETSMYRAWVGKS